MAELVSSRNGRKAARHLFRQAQPTKRRLCLPKFATLHQLTIVQRTTVLDQKVLALDTAKPMAYRP